MMQSRFLAENDYETLVEWWTSQNFTPPPKHKLPLNGTGGIMICKEGVDICAGFLYTTNSSIAWLEFTVANKEYRDKDRKEAIQFLISSLCGLAKKLEFDTVFTVCQHPSLINHFDKMGFSKDERKSTEMVKLL